METLNLEKPPERIEVFDNSHISGTNMVSAMIVAGPEGFIKNAYRKFNIKTAKASDDYAMMEEVLSRRYKKLDDNNRPDLLLIDGGKGQLSTAMRVLKEVGVYDQFRVVAIAKGEDRNAGREKLFLPDDSTPIILQKNDPVLHYLQRLRDEAHRFAVGAHRVKGRPL